jgi:hypothetical protein
VGGLPTTTIIKQVDAGLGSINYVVDVWRKYGEAHNHFRKRMEDLRILVDVDPTITRENFTAVHAALGIPKPRIAELWTLRGVRMAQEVKIEQKAEVVVKPKTKWAPKIQPVVPSAELAPIKPQQPVKSIRKEQPQISNEPIKKTTAATVVLAAVDLIDNNLVEDVAVVVRPILLRQEFAVEGGTENGGLFGLFRKKENDIESDREIVAAALTAADIALKRRAREPEGSDLIAQDRHVVGQLALKGIQAARSDLYTVFTQHKFNQCDGRIVRGVFGDSYEDDLLDCASIPKRTIQPGLLRRFYRYMTCFSHRGVGRSTLPSQMLRERDGILRNHAPAPTLLNFHQCSTALSHARCGATLILILLMTLLCCVSLGLLSSNAHPMAQQLLDLPSQDHMFTYQPQRISRQQLERDFYGRAPAATPGRGMCSGGFVSPAQNFYPKCESTVSPVQNGSGDTRGLS